jgi:hypothetical protein
MVSVHTSRTVDRGFDPRYGQTKVYETGICCFSAKHSSLRRKSKYWFACNQENISDSSLEDSRISVTLFFFSNLIMFYFNINISYSFT